MAHGWCAAKGSAPCLEQTDGNHAQERGLRADSWFYWPIIPSYRGFDARRSLTTSSPYPVPSSPPRFVLWTSLRTPVPSEPVGRVTVRDYRPTCTATVFNDTLGNGGTINSTPTSPATPVVGKIAYQQLAAKTFSRNPPTIGAGSLRFGSVATSFGFSSIEALFTQYTVSLVNLNDYVEMTVVLTNDGNLMKGASYTLFFGLHNSV